MLIGPLRRFIKLCAARLLHRSELRDRCTKLTISLVYDIGQAKALPPLAFPKDIGEAAEEEGENAGASALALRHSAIS